MRALLLIALLGIAFAWSSAAAFHDTTATATIARVSAQIEANPDAIYIDETEFYVLGERLLMHRNVHHAVEVFRWNLELHLTSWRAYYYLGEAYAQTGDTSKAIRRFERSLELNPEHPFVTRRLDAIRNGRALHVLIPTLLPLPSRR